MIDSELTNVYRTIIRHSCAVKPGERVLIEAIDIPVEALVVLVEVILEAGGIPIVNNKSQKIMCAIAEYATAEIYDTLAANEITQMKQAACFIGLRAEHNIHAMGHIASEQKKIILRHYIEPVHYRYRNEHMRYVYFRYPTESMAQNGGMNTDVFKEYYYRAVNIDYAKFSALAAPLKILLDKTETIRLTAPGTELKFKTVGLKSVLTDGRCNLPDCELMTVPLKDSVTGVIRFNIPSPYYGTLFKNIELEFDQGKAIRYSCADNNKELEGILSLDSGALYTGEFALGLNPAVTRPINDILFDEKMHGSVHIALGNSYPGMDNGNRSAIHWDLILAMRAESGGGALYFDEILIQKDGIFVIPELQHLNRESLEREITLLY